MTVNKELALQDWAKENPFLTGRLLFDFLGGENGECSISPVISDKAVKTYIDGTAIKEYTFAFQALLAVSDAPDAINTDNMFMLRKWQDWLTEQERARNYPDFGEKCKFVKLENLSDMPSLAMRYENGVAKYQFYAKFTYIEEV